MARSNAASALLPNGKLMVVGGSAGTNTYNATAELYDSDQRELEFGREYADQSRSTLGYTAAEWQSVAGGRRYNWRFLHR